MAAAAFKRTASRGAPFSPLKIARVIRAFSSEFPPTSADIGAADKPKSAGCIRSLAIVPPPIYRTDVVVANVISSRPSSPRKTKPSTPRSPNT